jgi:anhydro-N-acetylmuramic acid kinase
VEPDRVARLLALHARTEHVVVGLMSGTSADGVDAAVVRIADAPHGIQFELLAFVECAHAPDLRARVLEAAQLCAGDLARLDFDLGDAFADAAQQAIAKANVSVDLVGSHGQTIVHVPRGAGPRGATMQLGQAAIIAERTGLPVVSDFRVRDMALGGEGAPLVPLIDHPRLRQTRRTARPAQPRGNRESDVGHREPRRSRGVRRGVQRTR